MSWMDSWSRPSKSQATPAPYYLLPGGENTPYCQSCGRLISQRRTAAAASSKSEVRYCSARCRSTKPGRRDREIESIFVRFLSGEDPMSGQAAGGGDYRKQGSKAKKGRKVKGDQRLLAPCSEVEEVVFRRSEESGTDEPRTPESLIEPQDLTKGEKPLQHDALSAEALVDRLLEHQENIDGDVLARMSVRSGTRIRPPQHVSEVNGSVGGEKGWAERIEEDEEMLEKRKQGLRRAKEREMVRCAARRGVVFGFEVPVDASEGGRGGTERKKCEAVMNGKVVEPSFAKGDWALRWRE